MLQDSQSIPSGTQRRPTRRRSLLRKNTPAEDRVVSYWRLLLSAYAAAVVLYLAWVGFNVLTGTTAPVSAPALLSSLWPIAVFVVPITLAGYLATKRLNVYAHRFTPRSLRMARIAMWLGSGILGSLVGYEILHLISYGMLGISSSVLTTTLAANVIIVLFVSTAGAFLSSRKRGRILHRQEKLLTDEFEAAHRMQQSLLPDRDAHIYGFDISGAMYPAVEVGGDYYDYLSFADGSKGILVADASGKGIPAALVMAKFQGMAQALSIHVSNPEEFFVGLNDTLRVRLDRQSFITVGMMTIDFENRCSFWRAGHNPLLHFQENTGIVSELKPPGIALGLTHGGTLGNSLKPETFTLQTNDIILLYSDGLTEAMNQEGEQFGEERLRKHLEILGRQELNASEIRTAILDDIANFAAGTEDQHDDITIVVVKRV